MVTPPSTPIRSPDFNTSVFVGIDSAVISRRLSKLITASLQYAKLVLPHDQFPVSTRPGPLDRRQRGPRRARRSGPVQVPAEAGGRGDLRADAAALFAPAGHRGSVDHRWCHGEVFRLGEKCRQSVDRRAVGGGRAAGVDGVLRKRLSRARAATAEGGAGGLRKTAPSVGSVDEISTCCCHSCALPQLIEFRPTPDGK